MRLLPPLAPEAPAGYVAFVERRLDSLRREATRVVGDERTADEVYSDALADVALRWRWLELLRRLLRRPDAAEAYLGRAFVRRSRQWHEAHLSEIEIEVWFSDAAPPVARPTLVARSSAATRLARLQPKQQVPFAAIAEAAIAWRTAYLTHVRRRLTVESLFALAIALVCAAVLTRGS